jgi:cell division protein FtsL|tara:strand:+ start:492 stop:779 length:288 start_codon:yes stop_codon:yes gene_type:complete
MLSYRLTFILISLLALLAFVSSYKLVLQIYDHRDTFSNLETLKLKKEELSFQSNILIEEVQYYKNQISLRKFASENLGMIIPDNQQRVYFSRRID